MSDPTLIWHKNVKEGRKEDKKAGRKEERQEGRKEGRKGKWGKISGIFRADAHFSPAA